MKVTLHRDVLLPLLTLTNRTVSELSGPLSNLVLEVKDGALVVAGTNTLTTIITSTEFAQVHDPGSGRVIVPAGSLTTLVSNLPDGDVTIDTSPTTAVVTSAKSRTVLSLQDQKTYPVLPDPGVLTDYTDVPVVPFLRALHDAAPGVDLGAPQPGWLIAAVRDSHVMTASMTRMYRVRSTAPIPDLDIPTPALKLIGLVLTKSEAENFSVAQGKNAIVFRAGPTVLVVSRYNAAFPDVEQSFLKPALANDHVLTIDRDDLLGALKRAKVTADGDTMAVLMYLTKDGVTVSSKTANGSWTREEVPAHWEHDALTIALNLVHLTAALNVYPLSQCEFRIAPKQIGVLLPVLLTAHDDESFTDIVIAQLKKELL